MLSVDKYSAQQGHDLVFPETVTPKAVPLPIVPAVMDRTRARKSSSSTRLGRRRTGASKRQFPMRVVLDRIPEGWEEDLEDISDSETPLFKAKLFEIPSDSTAATSESSSMEDSFDSLLAEDSMSEDMSTEEHGEDSLHTMAMQKLLCRPWDRRKHRDSPLVMVANAMICSWAIFGHLFLAQDGLAVRRAALHRPPKF